MTVMTTGVADTKRSIRVDNPLVQRAPDDPIKRVFTFARDLAYGVVAGLWQPPFSTGSADVHPKWRAKTEYVGGRADPFAAFLREKWQNKAPSDYLLLSFGFL